MPTKRATTKPKSPKAKRPRKSAATKLDLYAKHKDEYVASAKTPALVRVGPARYLSITGRSAPGADEFTRAIGALYNVVFTIKMARKFAGKDYTVTKLEGLWAPESADFDPSNPATVWNWELMIRVPTFITEKEVRATIDDLIGKGKSAEVAQVRLVEFTEGECVQMLHVGPYTAEKPTLDKMREFAGKAGRRFDGRHHEIYFSDPRRVKPERLRTILRQPVA
jgi:hypothetical protein